MADIVSKYLTNPELIFEGFFRQVSSYSVFQNKTEFKVKVLTPPTPYTGPDSDLPSGNAETSVKYWFKGRITDPNMPHEKFLPDPCDETIAADQAAAAALISLHSTVYMDGPADFGVGSIITAFIEPGANNNKYDLQFMRYLKTDFSTPVETTLLQECETLANRDWASSDISGAKTGNYIGSQTQFQDEELSNGLIHQEQPGLIGKASTTYSDWPTELIFDAVADYERLAQAFYNHFNSLEYRASNPGAPEIKLRASGYRTFQKQVELKEEKPNLAATPGTSNHGWGMAIDIWNEDWRGNVGFESEYFLWMLENSSQYGWYHPYWASLQRNGRKEPWHFEYSNMGSVISGQRATAANTLADHQAALQEGNQPPNSNSEAQQNATALGISLSPEEGESEGEIGVPNEDPGPVTPANLQTTDYTRYLNTSGD
jgi:hypothetical protein